MCREREKKILTFSVVSARHKKGFFFKVQRVALKKYFFCMCAEKVLIELAKKFTDFCVYVMVYVCEENSRKVIHLKK